MKNFSSSSEYADLVVFNHSCPWVERGMVTVMCLAKEHDNIIGPGRESSDMRWLQCPQQWGTTILNCSKETSPCKCYIHSVKLYMGNLVLTTELITWIGYRKELNCQRFERQPFVRAIGGIVGCVWVIYAESGATLLVGIWWREAKNKLVESKSARWYRGN